MSEEEKVFTQLGEQGFERLCEQFYAQVPDDDILGPMYPETDMEGAQARLTSFLIYRFGGPQNYIQERGHPRLRMRHAPFQIDENAQKRWMELMGRALEQAEIPEPSRSTLRNFFEQMSRFLINQQTTD